MFRNFADNRAVIDENGNTYTYKTLFEEGEQFYQAINRRCLIFILCRNEKDSLVGYLSCMTHHIVPLMLPSGLDSELLLNLWNIYHPAYIWYPRESVLCVPSNTPIFETERYILGRTGLAEYALQDDLALLLTTSGSTGSPKLVRQSYKNIKANTESIVQYLHLDASERPITTLPMNYTYGLSIINTHLFVGATLLLTTHTIMQQEFWDMFRQEKATSFGGVPYTYEMLFKLRFFEMDLPSLKTITQAGGKLSPELHRQFAEYAQKNNRDFVVMYGQTEATARMAYLPPENSISKYGSMGIAIPGGRFELVDADNHVISQPDQIGELIYYGDNVTMGYAEQGEDLAKADEWKGRLVTGDIARCDADGFYFIVGRKKRFLKIFGNRVNLDEIERVIKGHFPECDCACGGKDDHLRIYLVNGTQKLQDSITQYVSEKTGLNHTAFEIIAVNEIPKNDAGKILYSQLEG